MANPLLNFAALSFCSSCFLVNFIRSNLNIVNEKLAINNKVKGPVKNRILKTAKAVTVESPEIDYVSNSKS
jgi:hypothetical protein